MTGPSAAMTVGQALKLLDLPPGPEPQALVCAFRTAVKAAHPDRGGDAERLRQVIEAHRLLKTLAGARLAFTPALRPAAAARPAARTLRLQITVQEALFGGDRRLELGVGRRIDVRLPPGLGSGDVLKLTGAGESRADMLLKIAVGAEPGVSLRGCHLWMEASVPAEALRPGARLEVDTPRGRRAFAAPHGVETGGMVRLRGEGLPARGRRAAGDLIIQLFPEGAAADSPARTLLRRFSARWAA